MDVWAPGTEPVPSHTLSRWWVVSHPYPFSSKLDFYRPRASLGDLGSPRVAAAVSRGPGCNVLAGHDLESCPGVPMQRAQGTKAPALPRAHAPPSGLSPTGRLKGPMLEHFGARR